MLFVRSFVRSIRVLTRALYSHKDKRKKRAREEERGKEARSVGEREREKEAGGSEMITRHSGSARIKYNRTWLGN